MSPSDFRLIGGKTFIAEKHQDAIDKQGDRQAESISKEMLKQQEVKLRDVPDVTKSDMGVIEKNKRLDQERKMKEKKKEKDKHRQKQKLMEQESGLMIDLEG